MRKHIGPSRLYRAVAAVGALFAPMLLQSSARAAAPATNPSLSDHELVQQLLERVNKDDAQINELREKLAAKSAPSTDAIDAVTKRIEADEAAIQEVKSSVADAVNKEPDEQTFPAIQFHGFADLTYHTSTQHGDHNAFALGELDWFITSQIAPDLSILNETVLSAEDNIDTYGIEVERLIVQYHPSEYFNIDAGRYHTQIGYYNSTFHHGTWFETATNRPIIDQFEDSGGIIPSHSVGVSIHGAIPHTEKYGLTYYVEVGNGEQYQAPTSQVDQVANDYDNNSYKAVNLALISRPEAIPGLQFGAGVYHDTLSAATFSKVDETLVHSHLVYKNADWEFMSEAYLFGHRPQGQHEIWSPAAFVQLARKMGKYTPYARFTYFDGASSDPVYQLTQQSGRHYGPAVGLRYDFSTFLALKFQYDYVNNSTAPGSYNLFTFQVDFTF